MDKFEKWRGFVPDNELATYAKATFGNFVGLGKRPALLNIDTTLMFVDPAYSQCGEINPPMLAAIQKMTDVFRELDLPIYYTRRDDRSHRVKRGMFNAQLGNAASFEWAQDQSGDEWPPGFAPRASDVVLQKNKPSAFFGTMLDSWLRYDEIDTLVVIGVSTSGCVRSAVNDAFSHNFRVTVVEDACGDRCPSAHRANMFDMDMKLGDVRSLSSVVDELYASFGDAALARKAA